MHYTGGKDFLEPKTERKNNTNTVRIIVSGLPCWRIVQFDSFSMDLQVPEGVGVRVTGQYWSSDCVCKEEHVQQVDNLSLNSRQII